MADWRLTTARVSSLIILHYLSFFKASCCVIWKRKILVCTVRLSAESYSHWEVARMFGVPQVCISKNGHRQKFHLGYSSVLREGPPISEEVVSSQYCKRLVTASYWSRRRARWPRLNLDSRRHRHVWERTQRRWELRHWRHCVLSDESCCFTVIVVLVCGNKLIDACIQPTDDNCCPSVNWWCWMEPSTANATSGFEIVSFPWRQAFLDKTLCMSSTMPRPTRHVTRLFCCCFSGKTGYGGLGLAGLESRYEPHWACFGTKWGSGS